MAPKRSRRQQRKETTPREGPLSKQGEKAPKSAANLSRTSRTIWQKILELIAVAGFVFAGMTFFYSFSPNLSITSSVPFEPSDPFSAPFSISNNGYLAIHDVQVLCGLKSVEFTNGSRFSKFSVATDQDKAFNFSPGESITARCRVPEVFRVPKGVQVKSADISLWVTFRPSFLFWFWHKERWFRFVLEKSSDGIWHWLPQPVFKEEKPK
jgi:hypothetical protein